MSDSLERFEKWALINLGDDYHPTRIALKRVARTAWQAAERETLERAAQLAENMYVKNCAENKAGQEIAKAIRALAGQTPQEETR